jgi:hypothetical protein
MTNKSNYTLREAAGALAEWEGFSIKLRNNIVHLREMLKSGSVEAFVIFGEDFSQIPISKQFWTNANSCSFDSLLKNRKKSSYKGTYHISFKQLLDEYIKKIRHDRSNPDDALNEISDQAKRGKDLFEVFICGGTLERALKNQGLKLKSKRETEKRGRNPKENWPEVMIEVAVIIFEKKESDNFPKSKSAMYYAEEALRRVKEEHPSGSFPMRTTLEPKIKTLLSKLDK